MAEPNAIEWPIKWVIYSEEKGLYLGRDRWTSDADHGETSVPGFEEVKARRVALYLGPKFKPQLREVRPDLPGFRLSTEQLARYGLPGVTGQRAPKGELPEKEPGVVEPPEVQLPEETTPPSRRKPTTIRK